LEIFGPVPSRRLGQSLGINNIPPKHCTYACVYCQLGKALSMHTERQSFYTPSKLFEAVKERLAMEQDQGRIVDYLTIVPDGEPTLDIHLGELITLLQSLSVPIAVITNASLIHLQDVQDALILADWVSVKVDAITDEVWKRIDRPHKQVIHDELLEGLLQFSARYNAESHHVLMTETMLIEGVNTGEQELRAISQFIAKLQPDTAYLSVPTRPPAESWVFPASEDSLARAYAILTEWVHSVEYLIGYEGNSFSNSGDSIADLLSITSVHPMRADAVEALLLRNGDDISVIHQLVEKGLISVSEYSGSTYYVRSFSRKSGR